MYSPVGGAPAKVLPIAGCGGAEVCNYDVFLSLTQEMLLTREQFEKVCSVLY